MSLPQIHEAVNDCSAVVQAAAHAESGTRLVELEVSVSVLLVAAICCEPMGTQKCCGAALYCFLVVPLCNANQASLLQVNHTALQMQEAKLSAEVAALKEEVASLKAGLSSVEQHTTELEQQLASEAETGKATLEALEKQSETLQVGHPTAA